MLHIKEGFLKNMKILGERPEKYLAVRIGSFTYWLRVLSNLLLFAVHFIVTSPFKYF